MPTPDPSARGIADLGRRLRKSESDLEQLRRLITRGPKAAPVLPGGPVGQAEVAATGGVSMDAGQGFLRDTVTYGAPSDPFAGTPGAAVLPVPSWCTVDGSDEWRINLAPGWYSLTVSFRLLWSAQADAPPALSLYMQGGNAVAYNETSVFALANTNSADNPRWGLSQVATHGPTFIGDGDGVWFECYGRGGSPTGPSVDGALVWNITKLG